MPCFYRNTQKMTKLSLAPFQGITDSVFRNVFAEHFNGIDKYYTPFFTAIQKDNSKNLRGEEIDPQHNDISILTPQILSNDAKETIRFAAHCKSLGYKEINLNMGCPFPRVANKGRGCGMMTEPDKTTAMLKDIINNIDIDFSIKCRLGYKNNDEIDSFIETFNILPFSEIILHPRTGKQLYGGTADINSFARAASMIGKPLIYNGDIFSIEYYKNLRERLPDTESFMLGRGILVNPFLAEDISGKTKNEKNRNTRLHSFMISLYLERMKHSGGSPKVIGRMKELWSYLMYSFEEPQTVWRKIKKVTHTEEYEDAVEEVFNNNKLIL